jgi:hypothetical protein
LKVDLNVGLKSPHFPLANTARHNLNFGDGWKEGTSISPGHFTHAEETPTEGQILPQRIFKKVEVKMQKNVWT